MSSSAFLSWTAFPSVPLSDVRATTSRRKLSARKSWLNSDACCDAAVWTTVTLGSSGLPASCGGARWTQMIASDSKVVVYSLYAATSPAPHTRASIAPSSQR